MEEQNFYILHMNWQSFINICGNNNNNNNNKKRFCESTKEHENKIINFEKKKIISLP